MEVRFETSLKLFLTEKRRLSQQQTIASYAYSAFREQTLTLFKLEGSIAVWLVSQGISPNKKVCYNLLAVNILNTNQSNWRQAVPTMMLPPPMVNVLWCTWLQFNHRDSCRTMFELQLLVSLLETHAFYHAYWSQ